MSKDIDFEELFRNISNVSFKEYWRSHFNENARKYNSLKKQVDMTINGKEAPDEQVEYRVNAIVTNLKLTKTDIIFDGCCGNGLITKKISNFVKKVYAMDFSDELIAVAKSINNAPNIEYMVGDVTKIDYEHEFPHVNKFNFYSCVQYLTPDDLDELLRRLSRLTGITVYMSNIPDINKIWDFYNTPEKREFFIRSVKEGRYHLGYWYDKTQIKSLSEKYGFRVNFLDIDKRINTAYYRFDVILYK